MSVEMTPEELRAFLEPARIAVLATINADATPHQAPVWYLYDDGHFLAIVPRTARYGRNALRDPRVSFCVQDERRPYRAVVAAGRADVHHEGSRDVLSRLAVRYLGAEEGERYAAETWADHGTEELVIDLLPARLSSWDYGKP